MVDASPAVRGSRVALPYAAPLPRIGPHYGGSDGEEKYEVVIVGVGYPSCFETTNQRYIRMMMMLNMTNRQGQLGISSTSCSLAMA